MEAVRRWALVSGLLALCQAPLAGPVLGLADQRDAQALFSAINDLMQFAAPGRSITWENALTGNNGAVKALRRNDAIGRICWDYERTYTEGGQVLTIDGTACEVTVGLWEIVEEGEPFGAGGAAASATPSATPSATATPETEAPAASKPSYDRAIVRETQALLAELGYRPGPVDGAYGRRTGDAIAAYQRARGRTVDRKPSQALLTDLRRAARDKVAAQSQAPTQSTTTPPGTQAPAENPESLPWLKPSIPDETDPDDLVTPGTNSAGTGAASGSGPTPAGSTPAGSTPDAAPAPSASPSVSSGSTIPSAAPEGATSESDASVWVPPPPPPPPSE